MTPFSVALRLHNPFLFMNHENFTRGSPPYRDPYIVCLYHY